MLIKLVLGATLALGLFATETAAMADSAQTRMLKGRTTQGHRIKLVLKQGSLRIQSFDIDLRCRDGSSLLLEESGFLQTRVKRNGSFHDAQFGRTDSVYFRGHGSERQLQGRIRVTDKERGSPRCASRWVGFRARAR
jgi:hypothetical protein